MGKLIRRLTLCAVCALLITSVGLIRDRKMLNEELIRFHVVANSNSREDQAIKLKVRDSVLCAIQQDLQKISDVNEAKQYLTENLPRIENVANAALKACGVDGSAVVSLCKEKFSAREYETFRLPAGVYESLRIIIGEGLGQNWWCVTFPSLCTPATTDDFSKEAVEAGMSEDLCQTLSKEGDYELRFFFLDFLGRIDNSFFDP